MTKDEQNVMHMIVNTLDKLTNAVAEIKKDVDKMKEENKGTVIRLSHNNSKIEYKFIKSHEVPVRGQENDRVKRRESYVKDFKEIKIGKINLTKGKGELALQALEIPGNESIEFRLLMLEKVQ